MRRTLVWLALAATLAACGGDDGSGTSDPYPLDDELRLNQIQVLGSHNSYHIQPRPDLFALLLSQDPTTARTFEYTHLPLAEQFSSQGIRQIELDVFADPAGGLYAHPLGLKIVTGDLDVTVPSLEGPGFKVFHVQDIDFESRCHKFVDCLATIRDWSDQHPGHVPLMIQVEAKDDPVGIAGFTVPIPIGKAELDALDAEIRSVLPAAKVITPDEVRGNRATLADAVRLDGWPTLRRSRGRLIFTLDNGGEKKRLYTESHPSLSGRILFTDSQPPEDEAAFVKLNEPVADFDRIRELVAAGFIVRTRADADTVEARSGNTEPRDVALASGAQFVSTDYPAPNPDFGTGYFVEIPGGAPARCNPVSAPSDCSTLDIENPARL